MNSPPNLVTSQPPLRVLRATNAGGLTNPRPLREQGASLSVSGLGQSVRLDTLHPCSSPTKSFYLEGKRPLIREPKLLGGMFTTVVLSSSECLASPRFQGGRRIPMPAVAVWMRKDCSLLQGLGRGAVVWSVSTKQICFDKRGQVFRGRRLPEAYWHKKRNTKHGDLLYSVEKASRASVQTTTLKRVTVATLSRTRQVCQYLRNFLAGASCISELGRYLHVGEAGRLPTSPSPSLEARTGYMLAFYVYAGMISPGRRLKARLASDRLICRLALRPCEKCLFGSDAEAATPTRHPSRQGFLSLLLRGLN
ncbi:hypothetical protein M752DRAFT_225111 [Aspergillus phoenicis ATCC 13157]|uniref:Uncharacterized protein n=3 Tax=Aspergillus TaxID=5052 RepID=A2R3S9_ASPNC|nr:hypothetical protein An14g05360 [Aspergillus niger]RDK37016.1 hypothetical protein M752DRAFT_225111 [Aspergillus phoenicis ATCC 13157]CAK42097.1 hypothetical protein An14g05360 [Aspergillus niger]